MKNNDEDNNKEYNTVFNYVTNTNKQINLLSRALTNITFTEPYVQKRNFGCFFAVK